MKDDNKTKEQLIQELIELRRKIADWEVSGSERRDSEEALRVSVRKWQAAFDAMNDSICLIDLEGKILQCNKAMSNLFGNASGEIIGKSCCEIMHGTTEPIHWCPIVRVRETRVRENLEMPIGDKWFSITADPLMAPAGELIGAVHTISEITERKRAEKALLESEEKYRSLVESTDDSIYLVDNNYKYLYMNNKHMSRMGFREKEYAGRSYLEFHTAEENNDFMKEVDRVFETAQHVQHEHKSHRDDKYFFRTLSPMKEPDGKVMAVSVVSKNITALKQIEAEREKLIVELQEALAKIKTLKGLIPVCAWCGKVRDDQGYWNELHTYVRTHSDADFTHGICLKCLEKIEDE